MRERLARALEEGRSGEAADRVLRTRFWSPRVDAPAAEIVDLASRRSVSAPRED